MAEAPFDVLDDGKLTRCPGSVEPNTVRLSSDALDASLGWQLKPEGLCRDGVCIPAAPHEGLVTDDGIDLPRFCGLLGRPFALDLDERVISLGASASERGAALRSGRAPDFELPDLSGRLHSLRDQLGKKVLLVAYASW